MIKMTKSKQRGDGRTQKAIKKVRQDIAQELPINKFLNEKTEDGNAKYPVADKISKYLWLDPDPVLNANRLANSLVHEIQWHQNMAVKYLQAFSSDEKVEMFDRNGQQMSKEECYIAHIQETLVQHTVLDKLRQHLFQGLLPKVSDIFTMQQYNDYVLEVETKLKELGHELFPTKVEIVSPL